MIQLLNDSRFKKEPKYYCINPKSIRGNFAFSHKEDLEEWVKDECIHYNIKKEEIETGKISDRKDLEVVSVSVCGGDIRKTASK
jgi:hypothetical protein